MTGVLSKIEAPIPNDIPSKREVLIVLLRAGAIGFLTFYLVRWALRNADPTHQQKQSAKAKAMDVINRLGISKSIQLNEHEVMIASHLVDPNHLKVSWADVAGLDDTIEQLKKTVIYPILAHQKVRYSQLIQPPKGVLLYGPPGCGKTLIAKAMAKEAKCWFINLDVSVLTDKWYGESQKLTGAVFTLAEKIQPCIIFIDEIDSLLRVRASQDHEVTAMMKAQFMSLWDGLITDPKKTVIVMGATNRPKDMDTAILRRMASKFFIPVPDVVQRKHILNLTLRNENTAPDFNLTRLAEITEGFSGSDLKEVARSAAVACLADMSLSRDNLLNRAHPTSLSTANLSTEESGSWFQRFNPFSRSSRASSVGLDSENENYMNGDGEGRVGSSGDSVLRAISMKDFEHAVMKAKEARTHCTAAVVLKRIELD